MYTSPNMGLTVWNLLSDLFDHTQLENNNNILDVHDHTNGKGVQIPTSGIADGAITDQKIASGTITGDKINSSTTITVANGTFTDLTVSNNLTVDNNLTVTNNIESTSGSLFLQGSGATLSIPTGAIVVGTGAITVTNGNIQASNGEGVFILGVQSGDSTHSHEVLSYGGFHAPQTGGVLINNGNYASTFGSVQLTNGDFTSATGGVSLTGVGSVDVTNGNVAISTIGSFTTANGDFTTSSGIGNFQNGVSIPGTGGISVTNGDINVSLGTFRSANGNVAVQGEGSIGPGFQSWLSAGQDLFVARNLVIGGAIVFASSNNTSGYKLQIWAGNASTYGGANHSAIMTNAGEFAAAGSGTVAYDNNINPANGFTSYTWPSL